MHAVPATLYVTCDDQRQPARNTSNQDEGQEGHEGGKRTRGKR